jgi:hypothetical protein
MMKNVLVFAIALFCSIETLAESVEKQLWDQTLPQQTVRNVSIQVNSLSSAWKQISSDYLLRSVLVIGPETNVESPFVFQATETTVSDVFHALASNYQLSVTQDAVYGVTWMVPVSMSYSKVLDQVISVAEKQHGLPMLSGVLIPLSGTSPRYFYPSIPSGTFANAFNYSVDVDQGEFTIRDLLNICCCENISKSFVITYGADDRIPLVTVVNLPPESRHPVGAQLFWNIYCGSPDGPRPSYQELARALASSDPLTCWAAKNFLVAEVHVGDLEAIIDVVASAAPTDENVRLVLSLCSIFAREEWAGFPGAKELLAKALEADPTINGNKPLAMLAALELSRLGGDGNPLDQWLNSDSAVISNDLVSNSDFWRILRLTARKSDDHGMARRVRNWLLGPSATQKELDEPVSAELQFSTSPPH